MRAVHDVILPYQFDTSHVWRMILTGAVTVEGVIFAGVVYGLLVSRSVIVPLMLSGLILGLFIRLFVRHQSGSIGTITADRVVIRPNTLFGIRLPGPHGDYPIDRFSALRVERMSGRSGLNDVMQGGPHERIWLLGREPTPSVLVARTDDEAGRALGRELGVALRLPVQERHEPY